MTAPGVLVISDDTDRDGGWVTERLRELGFGLVAADRDDLPRWDAIDPVELVLSLGSQRSAHAPAESAVVTAESRLVRESLASGVPVMGICYGAQLMARALGGTSWRADEIEIGWHLVDTIDSRLCPSGPWAQLHHDVFAPGTTSRVLGTTWRGPQCFIDESFGARAIGWQFHPEVTPETYQRWLDEEYHGDTGVDVRLLMSQARSHQVRNRRAAHDLVDAALQYLEVTVPSPWARPG